MENIKWIDYVGDVEVGRKHLGKEMPVEIYRLFEYTMKDELTKQFGKAEANKIFREAGKRAGTYFTKQVMNKDQNIYLFFTELQKKLSQFKIGLLRVEEMNKDCSHIIVSISEDLDCSGLPVIGESVCHYDEGFLIGVLESYTGREYDVIEVDCWAKGGRVCRFQAVRKQK